MAISQVVIPGFHVMRSTHGEASLPLLRKEGPLLEVTLVEGPAYTTVTQVERADAFPVQAIVQACIQATEETPHQERLLLPYGVDGAWARRVKDNAGVLSALSDERKVQMVHAAIDRDLEGGLREEAAEALRPVLFTMRAGKMDRWIGGGLEDLSTLAGTYAMLVNVHAAVTHPFVQERCLALALPQDKLDRVGQMKQKLYGYFTTVASVEAAPETNALQIRVARSLLLDELRLLWSQVQWLLPPAEQEKFAMGRLLGRSPGRTRPDAPDVPVPVPPVAGPVTPAGPIAGGATPPGGAAPAGGSSPGAGAAPAGGALPAGASTPPGGAIGTGPVTPPAGPVMAGLPLPPPGTALPPPGTVLGNMALPGQAPQALVVQPDGSAAWVPAGPPPTPRRGGKRQAPRAGASPVPSGRSRRR